MTAPGPCFCATRCSVPTVPPAATPAATLAAATLAAATLAVPPADTLAVPPPRRRGIIAEQRISLRPTRAIQAKSSGRRRPGGWRGQFAATRASGRSETGSPSAG